MQFDRHRLFFLTTRIFDYAVYSLFSESELCANLLCLVKELFGIGLTFLRFVSEKSHLFLCNGSLLWPSSLCNIQTAGIYFPVV